MDTELFQGFLDRIEHSGGFLELADLDKELRTMPKGRLPSASVEYLKEEIEIRSGPVVYTAMTRLTARDPQQGFVAPIGGEEEEDEISLDVIGHIKGTVPLAASDLDDDDRLEEIVESISGKMIGKPFHEEEANTTMDALLKKPGFLDELAIAEREERGEFEGVEPSLAVVLKDLAACANTAAVARVMEALQDSPLSEGLDESQQEFLKGRIHERLSIASGVENNLEMIEARRKARSMGMTLDESHLLNQKKASKEVPILIRSFLETLRDESKDLAQILGDSETPSPEEMIRLQGVIEEKVKQRVMDAQAAEELIRSLGRKGPPQAGR